MNQVTDFLLQSVDSLKEAVGNESIKLLVSVDEDDYEAGRLLLLENMKRSQQC